MIMAALLGAGIFLAAILLDNSFDRTAVRLSQQRRIAMGYVPIPPPRRVLPPIRHPLTGELPPKEWVGTLADLQRLSGASEITVHEPGKRPQPPTVRENLERQL